MNRTPTILHLPAAARIAMPWKNGGGVTREVARDPSEGEVFRWRVSVAEVASEGPFSKFAGYRRWISVIEGRGMELKGADGDVAILRPFQPYGFDGDSLIDGALPFGPVSDLNVIYDPGAIHASLGFQDKGRRLRSTADGAVLAINLEQHAVRVPASASELSLARLDAVMATAGAGVELPAGSHFAVIELTSLPRGRSPAGC